MDGDITLTDWLSAGALFSRNVHGPITNNAEKQNKTKQLLPFFYINTLITSNVRS